MEGCNKYATNLTSINMGCSCICEIGCTLQCQPTTTSTFLITTTPHAINSPITTNTLTAMTATTFQTQLMNLQANLLNFAMTLTANRDDAYDLLQDTTVKALTNREKYADDTNFKGMGVHDHAQHLHQQLPPHHPRADSQRQHRRLLPPQPVSGHGVLRHPRVADGWGDHRRDQLLR